MLLDRLFRQTIVTIEQFAPALISDFHRYTCRADDVGERESVRQFKPAIDREIALDDGEIDVLNRTRRLRRLQRHDLDSARVLDDVEFGDVDRLAIANLDQAEVAQNP